MAMVGQTPSLESIFPGYGQKRREGVTDVLIEALMMLVAPQAAVIKKFPLLESPFSEGRFLSKFRVRPGGPTEQLGGVVLERNIREKGKLKGLDAILPGKWEQTTQERHWNYAIEGLDLKSRKWEWVDSADNWLDAEQAAKRWNKAAREIK